MKGVTGPSTQKLYKTTLERAFGDRDIARLKPVDVTKAVDAWPESTRATLRAALKDFWGPRVDLGAKYAAAVPAARRVKRARMYPSEEDAQQFEAGIAKVTPERARPILRVFLRVGMRTAEFLELSRANVVKAIKTGDLKLLGKGNKERVVPVDHVKDALEELLEHDAARPRNNLEYLETGSRPWKTVGEILASAELSTQRNLLSRYVKRAAQLGGLDPKFWHPHMLRHTFATRMMRDGADVRVVQAALGHANITQTSRYEHPGVEDIRRHVRKSNTTPTRKKP